MELLQRVTEIDSIREKVEQYHKLISHYLNEQLNMIRHLALIDHAMNNDETDTDTISDKLTVQPKDMIFTETNEDEFIEDVPGKILTVIPESKKKTKKTTLVKTKSRANLPSRPVDFDISLKPQTLTDSIKIMPSYDENVKVISTKQIDTYKITPPQDDILKGNTTKKGAKPKRGRPKK